MSRTTRGANTLLKEMNRTKLGSLLSHTQGRLQSPRSGLTHLASQSPKKEKSGLRSTNPYNIASPVFRGDIFSTPGGDKTELPGQRDAKLRAILISHQSGERGDMADVIRSLTISFEESIAREKALISQVKILETDLANAKTTAAAQTRTMEELVGVASKAAALAEARAVASERRAAERERAVDEDASLALGLPSLLKSLEEARQLAETRAEVVVSQEIDLQAALTRMANAERKAAELIAAAEARAAEAESKAAAAANAHAARIAAEAEQRVRLAEARVNEAIQRAAAADAAAKQRVDAFEAASRTKIAAAEKAFTSFRGQLEQKLHAKAQAAEQQAAQADDRARAAQARCAEVEAQAVKRVTEAQEGVAQERAQRQLAQDQADAAQQQAREGAEACEKAQQEAGMLRATVAQLEKALEEAKQGATAELSRTESGFHSVRISASGSYQAASLGGGPSGGPGSAQGSPMRPLSTSAGAHQRRPSSSADTAGEEGGRGINEEVVP